MKINRCSVHLLLGMALFGTICSGCGSSTGPGSDARDVCRPSGDPAYVACARLVVFLDVVPEPWPPLYRWSIKTIAANPTLSDETFTGDPKGGVVELDLAFHLPLDQLPGDTASVWVVVKLLEDPQPTVVGVPLPVFAQDSVLQVTHWVGPGERLEVDTLFLTLTEPEG